MLVLDTDHLGVIQRPEEPARTNLLSRLSAYDPPHIYVTIVSFHENSIGWNAYLSRARSAPEWREGYRRFETMLRDYSKMNVLPFDDGPIGRFSKLRADGVRIPTMDLRIAAICLAKDYTLLSRNLKDFRLVPGLKVEDWTNPV